MIKFKKQNIQKSVNSKLKNELVPETRVIDSLKGALTNLSYGFQGVRSYFNFKKSNKQQKKPAEEAYFISGIKYKSKQLCQRAHKELVWFTYRKNIRINQKLQSDVGWGCLIRVGQMALAMAIKRYLAFKFETDNMQYLISAFLDEDSTQIKYSLKSISEYANHELGIQPGSWFSFSDICYSLKGLHTKNPLKATNNLRIVIFNSSIIILKQIYEELGLKICNCLERKINCHICHKKSQNYSNNFSSKQKKNYQLNHINDRHILLMIIVRTGVDQFGIQEYENLLQLIQLQIFLCSLGGIPQKARLITGKCNEKLSYLDPHYVQNAMNRFNLSQNLKSFSCQQYRLMSRQELDPSMTICFYLKTLDDLSSLILKLDEICSKNNEKKIFIPWAWETNQDKNKQEKPKYTKLNQNKNRFDNSFEDLDDKNSSWIEQSSFIL